jgi:ribosomal protein S18 acetylase RimI-like enzyme
VSLTSADLAIRALVPADRSRVEAMTRGVGLFWDHEVGIALEVFDDATGSNPAGIVDPDYETAGVLADGHLVGWAAWGPRPADVTTFDLYWIVVDRAMHGRGIGTALLDEMMRRLAGRRIAGRAAKVVVETSGRSDYQPTRAFYQRHGYQPVGRTPDFYAPGDDQVVFEKEL